MAASTKLDALDGCQSRPTGTKAKVSPPKIAWTLTGTASARLPPTPRHRRVPHTRPGGLLGGRLRWSGPYEATLSEAVCAGSNLAGVSDQRLFSNKISVYRWSGHKPLAWANADVISVPCPHGAQDEDRRAATALASNFLVMTAARPLPGPRPLLPPIPQRAHTG